MKKILTLIVLALVTMVNVGAQNYIDFTVNGLNYRVWTPTTVIIMPKSEDGSSTYSSLSSSNFSNTVTYNGTTYTVEGVADNAFAKAKWSGTLTLPTSITTIGSYAFDAAEGATLALGPNVQILLEAAFANNKFTAGYTVDANNPYFTALTSSDGSGSDGVLASKDKKTLVSFPGGKKGSGWFSSLSYTIPNCITEVGDFAFFQNANVTSITIPSSVERIGKAAFYECTGFSRLTIPGTIKEFGSSAFCGCVNVTSLTFNSPCQYTEIPGHCFFYLMSLKTLTLPEGVKRLGLMSFGSCEALTTINLSSTVELLDSTCFLDNPITKIDLKNVKVIGHMAFSGCSELSQIIGGNSLQEIHTSAFAMCNKLTTVTIPESLRVLYRNAFFRCTGITTLNLPSTLEYMTGNPAVGCTKLQTITIPESCPHFKIIDGAVYATTGATDLEETPNYDGDHDQPTVLVGVPAAISNKVLNVPEGVYAFGYQACREVKLTEMYLPKTMKEFRSSAVGTIGTLTKITCLAKEPPTIASTFAAADYTNALVTVPTISLDAYKAATYWSQFQNWATVDVEFDDDEPVVGDLNGDGKVDIADVNICINIILETNDDPEVKALADLSGDGKVDVSDVNILINIILEVGGE